MPKLEALFKGLLALLLGLVLVSAGWAQDPTAKPSEEKPAPVPTEKKISPQEAEELFRSVDEILQFASKDTGLPIKEKVKRKLTSRDEVSKYVTEHLSEDKDAQRLRRSELVLKKFGLLPRDFDLQTFLISMLREQIAGYYDPKTKYVNLLDWLDAIQQRPVLAHELTHALQDQSFDLQKWMKVNDLFDKKVLTWADLQNDESGTARQAVVEGQAMVVLIDYMLSPVGKSLKTSPEFLPVLKKGMLDSAAASPELSHAPRLLREALLFPYRYGLDFVVVSLSKAGQDKAFAGMFVNPPTTSRQIMEPDTYLSGETIAPLPVPDFHGIFKDYDRFDVGSIGEFDVSILIDEYANESASDELYPHWRGGYYYAVRHKGKPEAPLGLVYVSRWSNPESAAQFAAVYAKALPKRYHDLTQPGKDAPATLNDLQGLASLTGERTWQTEDGPVTIAVTGDLVLAVESLEPPITDRLRQEVMGTPVAGPK